MKLGPNEFLAGSILTLNCTVEGSMEHQNCYMWSRTGTGSLSCTECNTSMLTVGGPLLYSDSAGNYTCTVNGSLTSRPFTVSVVGEC